jgi:hypothetical protein
MNRIILIGNGFDLAHGLKTSYQDFIDDFWERKIGIFIDTCKHGKLRYRFDEIRKSSTYEYLDDDITIIMSKPYQPINVWSRSTLRGYKSRFLDLCDCLNDTTKGKLTIGNNFLKRISENIDIHNWIDIEEEYYASLNGCLEKNNGIERLNTDFLVIQTELENYLKRQVANGINQIQTIEENIYLPLFVENSQDASSTVTLENILFLNFNYTHTERPYVRDGYQSSIIHIHGELENENNPIIFGYGDEIDTNYKLIEEKKDNKYLENIKSIKYLETNNYKKLLTFINSREYEIFIMGHSCGISDRTLLNTLFEHENCLSVKVFYHKKEDGTDNFSDIVRNISRNFNNKRLMRKIVANRTECVPLS